jgi:hypothetical protein
MKLSVYCKDKACPKRHICRRFSLTAAIERPSRTDLLRTIAETLRTEETECDSFTPAVEKLAFA